MRPSRKLPHQREPSLPNTEPGGQQRNAAKLRPPGSSLGPDIPELMNSEPTGYEDEPREVFLPLPPDLAAQFYKIELDSFVDDIHFYKHHLPKAGRIIELGCGTGRLIRPLTNPARTFWATDISTEMLTLARQKCVDGTDATFLCMDMCRPAVSGQFAATIIGYNTLNILPGRAAVSQCLNSCRHMLVPGGILLVQLYVQSQPMSEDEKKTFQFQIFDHPAGGQLIKEVRKSPNQHDQTVDMRERYRLRLRTGTIIKKEDYETCYSVLAWDMPEWQQILKQSGFTIEEMWDSYSQQRQETPSSLRLLKLTRQ